MRPFVLIFSALSVLFGQSVLAAEPDVRSLGEGAISPPAVIEDIAWLAGYWSGEGLGGIAEEVIAPPAGNQMMGMFRAVGGDNDLKFYEFYLFVEREGSLALRIKHFTPALHGWETKDEYEEFALVAIEGSAVYFDGLTYALTGPDELSAAVRVEGQGILSFRLDRKQLGEASRQKDQ